jgi:hypothetical protein
MRPQRAHLLHMQVRIESAINTSIVCWYPNTFILISRQISYGQMIACENPDCATEWFHFACVGLKTEVGSNILFIGWSLIELNSSKSIILISTSAEGTLVLPRVPLSLNRVVGTLSYTQISSSNCVCASIKHSMDCLQLYGLRVCAYHSMYITCT